MLHDTLFCCHVYLDLFSGIMVSLLVSGSNPSHVKSNTQNWNLLLFLKAWSIKKYEELLAGSESDSISTVVSKQL